MIERKYLAHFIDANFGKGEVANYRLGKDIEEYNIELNGEVEKKKNILGEQSVVHKGYEPQTSIDTFYPDYDDELSQKLFEIANERLTGDNVKTTMVDVILKPDGTVVSAYREDVVIDVKSLGGATEGVNTPFDVIYAGNRVKGNWDVSTKTFTPDEN
jgi:hypothetical protein